jgi:tungstate transport system substrate-binding protein
MIGRSRTMTARRGLLALALVAFVAIAAVGSSVAGGVDRSTRAPDNSQLILATTTSVNDSGLLRDVVLPAYTKAHPGITVKTVAVGSGDAIALAQRGDADVVIVHSPSDEAGLMNAGDGTFRIPFAYNYFTIVGPQSDPAGVKSLTTAVAAFKRIAAQKRLFVSRADKSGTNKKELKLWYLAGVTKDPSQTPTGSWYIKTGQGMGASLLIASQKNAYTLSDTATFLAMRSKLRLIRLLRRSADLKNQYDIILLNQAKHDKVNSAGAEFLAAWLVSYQGQRAIGRYGVAKYGQPLFYPNAYTISLVQPTQ